MKKEVFIYSLAIGINRGAALLFMPLLIGHFSTGEYGVYSYIQLLFQIIFPLVCLNINSGIAREGADSPELGHSIFSRTLPWVIFSSFIFLIIGSIFGYYCDANYILAFSIALGGIEAIHNMQLALFRAFDRHKLYLLFTILKTIGFLLLLLAFSRTEFLTLKNVLIAQVVWSILVSLCFIPMISKLPTLYKILDWKTLKPVVLFSMYLVPHGISQWLMNASSRLVIKHELSTIDLGLFGIAYSLASVFILVNSGIAIVLPQNFVRNASYWGSRKGKIKFFSLYAIAFCLILGFVIAAGYINSRYYNFIKIPEEKGVFGLFCVLGVSLYLTGYYYYYANFLFLHKKSKTLSRVTVCTAVISLLFSYIFVHYFGLMGGAIANVISYVVYCCLVVYETVKIEKSVRWDFYSEGLIPLSTIGVFLSTIFLINIIF